MTLTLAAPAKVNLYLHVTGRRPDGYHLLDSMTVFTDIGDTVEISASPAFGMTVSGPYAPALRDDDNIAMRAAHALAALCGRAPLLHINLTKTLPVASGIGGGSADAAAVLRGMLQLWRYAPADVAGFDNLLLRLGADVPVCFHAKSCRMTGIGDRLTPVPALPDLAIVLVNPGQPCPTGPVFAARAEAFAAPAIWPAAPLDFAGLIKALGDTANDLTVAACQIVPAIRTVMDALAATADCALARMSGSGATCFGLYPSDQAAMEAAARLREAHPDWWIQAGRVLSG